MFSLNAFGQGERLFMPITYDRNVARSYFSLNSDTTDIVKRQLMSLYLHHPEIVRPSHNDSITKEKNTVPLPIHEEMANDIPEDKIPPMANLQDAIALTVTRPHFWTFAGDYSLQLSQNYASSNWYQSSENNYAAIGAITLQYNYNNKQRVKWDNKLELKMGLLSTDADTINKVKTTQDLLRYTTTLSLQAHKKWYYATRLIAYTQFAQGRKSNDRTVYSDFMSPFNMNLSLGMEYVVDTSNKKLTGTILFAPISYNFKYVDRLNLATSFGIDEGKHVMHDYGPMINAEVVWKPIDWVKWQSRFYAFGGSFKRFEMEWENTITLQFNRFIGATLFLYPRFDDSADKKDSNTYFQFREYVSVGFTYSM